MPRKLNKAKLLGVLAGGDLSLDRLSDWAQSADVIFAADGGANFLKSLGMVPNVIVGDLDSYRYSTKDDICEIIRIEDQNFSDCDKLLLLATERGYSAITLIGVEGDQLDHVLGTLFSAARSSIDITLVLRKGIGRVLRGPASLDLSLPINTRLSLMPLEPSSGVTLTGAEWPLEKATLNPLGRTSLSNRATGPVHVTIASGAAVLFLSHPELEKPAWDN